MHVLQRVWLSPLSQGAFALAVPLTANAQSVVPSNDGFNASCANGTTEALQSLQSDNSFTQSSSRVKVPYLDKSGRRVARFFKPAH
jgi:hypothetical protein